jgi:hypothetical protein
MREIIENEWMERNRYNRGKPVGFRQYKTDLSGDVSIEDVILEVEKPMQARNEEKTAGKDEGIFKREYLEDVWFDPKDCLWRYVVSMEYIQPTNEIRKKCQENKIKF